jgi:thiol-disulfide isomerase/thioredoxin
MESMRPPSPPPDWLGKSPTREQSASFNKTLASAARQAADKARDFYTRFPDHPKAAEARERESHMRTQADIFEQKSLPPTEQDKIHEKINEINRQAMTKQGEGYPAILKEFEKGLRGLLKEYPKNADVWNQFGILIQTGDQDTSKRISKEIVAAENAPEALKESARTTLKRMDAVGLPFELQFTSLDGRVINTTQMKGKVLLIDFWATWCGPCIRELPNVKKVYNEYHGKGLEIIGISLDKSKAALTDFVARNEMHWPQYFDGKGWLNSISTQYGINAIPAMFLVDQKGILRDLSAGDDLEAKVKQMLKAD